MMATATPAIEAVDLSKSYGRRRALSGCTLALPAGRVVGLVGPNGAGKSTLLELAAGLLAPTEGTIRVLGAEPARDASVLAKVGYLAQATPAYARLTIDQHLAMGRWLNTSWDDAFARRRIDELGLDPRQRAGALSGGQRAQLALTLAVAKRPELLLLDEPVAALDPLARREFLGQLMEVAASGEVSIVMSSHLLADLERVCDHLVVLVNGQVSLAGDVDDLLRHHVRVTGAPRDAATLPADWHVVEASHTERQSSFLVRAPGGVHDPHWTVTPVNLDDLVLASMRPRSAARSATSHLEVTR